MRQIRALIWFKWTMWRNRPWSGGRLASLLVWLLIGPALVLGSLGLGFVVYIALTEEASVTPQGILLGVSLVFTILFGFWVLLPLSQLMESEKAEMFELRRFLHYPVSPFRLYLLNLVSAMFDPWVLFFLPSGVGLVLALLVRYGAPALPAALAVPLFVLFSVAVRNLGLLTLGEMLQSRRLRGIFILVVPILLSFLFLVPLFAASVFDSSGGETGEEVTSTGERTEEPGTGEEGAPAEEKVPPDVQFVRFLKRTDRIIRFLPPAWAGRMAVVGFPEAVGILPVLLSILFLALLGLVLWAGSAAVRRMSVGKPLLSVLGGERKGKRRKVKAELPGGLFTGSVFGAIAAKELRYFLRSARGRYGFISILLILTIWWLVANEPRSGAEAYPFALIMSILVVYNFCANAFGWDGEGFRFYFFSPIRMRTVFLGKDLARAIYLLWMVATAHVIYVPLFGVPSPLLALVGVLALIPTYLFLSGVGHLLSIWFPIPIDITKLAQARQKVTLAHTLANSFFLFVGVVPLGCAMGVVLMDLAVWGAFAIIGASTVVFGLLYLASLEMATAQVEAAPEQLLEALLEEE